MASPDSEDSEDSESSPHTTTPEGEEEEAAEVVVAHRHTLNTTRVQRRRGEKTMRKEGRKEGRRKKDFGGVFPFLRLFLEWTM